jgi:hypothetical protein
VSDIHHPSEPFRISEKSLSPFVTHRLHVVSCAVRHTEIPTCNKASEQVFMTTLLRHVAINPRPGPGGSRSTVTHPCGIVRGCVTASHGSMNWQGCGRRLLVFRPGFEPSVTSALICLVKFRNVRTCNEVRVMIFFRCVPTRLLSVFALFIYRLSFTWS